MFSDSRDRGIHVRPYTGAYIRYAYIDYSHEFIGSALARFERSTFPEHKDTRTVMLRFLKIITPVKCVIPLYDDYIPPPEEGELYRRSRSSAKFLDQAALWSVNVDKPNFKGLQLLWDA